MRKEKVTAVIPALNEEETIADVLKGVRPHVDEIILVDDGSTDRTAEIARRQDVVVLSNGYNKGYEPSIDDGFALGIKRGATILMTFDGDGQHDARNIPAIIEPILNREADIVVGSRPYYPRVTEHLFALIAKRRAGITDPLCGLKAYRSEVYKDIGYFDRNSSIGVQFLFSAKERGYKIAQRKVSITERKDESRFGRSLVANWKILKAIVKTL